MKEYKITDWTKWGNLATFVPNKQYPVYNWFYYKEGFARELVLESIGMFGVKDGLILDPFCGSGTTLLVCQEKGIDSAGFDVHPVSVFASRVKSRQYDPEAVKKEAASLIRPFPRSPMPQITDKLLRKAFAERTLRDIFYYREQILSIADSGIRELFLLALMNVSLKCSFVWKDGSVLKFRKRPIPPIKDMLRRQLNKMASDLESMKRKECETTVGFGDSRKLSVEEGVIDAIITSPPYLNKIEYTKIYEIEQKLFLDSIKEMPPLRSYIGLGPEKLAKDFAELSGILGLEDKSLPMEALPYLTDMFQSIREMHRVCREGAYVGLVVGNGCFPTGVVESDVLLSRLAEHAGFKVEKIGVLNKRWCTKNRTEKVGELRESMCVWKK